jgi:anti-sigma factor RsiW
MLPDDQPVDITDLADGTLAGPEWDAWLAAHPDAAAEVEIARRVRALLTELRAASIVVPAGFEARLMERVRGDTTLLELLDLGLAGCGRALLELLELLFGLAPAPQPALT